MFLVVYVEDKSYIVDLTYLQFFLKDRCSKDMFKEKEILLEPERKFKIINSIPPLKLL